MQQRNLYNLHELHSWHITPLFKKTVITVLCGKMSWKQKSKKWFLKKNMFTLAEMHCWHPCSMLLFKLLLIEMGIRTRVPSWNICRSVWPMRERFLPKPSFHYLCFGNVRLITFGALFPTDQQLHWIALYCEPGLIIEQYKTLLLFSLGNVLPCPS